MKFFSLKNKVALVIGGTRGIGEGIAVGLSEAGAIVVISSRHDHECEQTARRIVKITRNKVSGIPMDITAKSSLQTAIEHVTEEFGHIDILVNSAGINVRKDTVDFTEEDWDLVQDVQLKGSFLACQMVGRQMIQKGIRGKIINISSIDSMVVSRKNIVSYMAAKGGISQLTKALAVEWADRGICVNAIAPGYFETVMTRPLFRDESTKRELFRNIPQKRFGRPYADLAGLAVYLASPASDYTTGQTIFVDGGYTLI